MNVKRYGGVNIGEGSVIGDFSVIGVPPSGKKDGEIETVIGKNANIRSHSVIYAGNRIGSGFQTGHGVLVRENNTIGDNVSIGSHSVVERDTVIGSNVRIHSNSFIPEYTTLKDGAWIGPGVVLTNSRYPLSKNAKLSLRGPTIEENAKIGAKSIILPGVRVGKNALVGAGSVVTRDVPDGMVVTGCPARKTNKIENIKEYA